MWDRHIVGRSAIGRAGKPPGTAVADPSAGPLFAAYLERRDLVLGCDYRGPITEGSCGCAELRVCWLGKGRGGTVVPADCLACVSRSDTEPEPERG